MREQILQLIDDWIILQVEERGLGQFADDIGSPQLADQIIARFFQPDTSVVTLIADWIDERLEQSTMEDNWQSAVFAHIDDLAARLEAWWKARPERWQASVATIEKLRLARRELGHSAYSWHAIAGFDSAIEPLGLLEAVQEVENA